MKWVYVLTLTMLLSCSSGVGNELVDTKALKQALSEIGVIDQAQFKQIIIISPNYSCSSCNVQLVDYYKQSEDDTFMIFISSSFKEVNLFLTENEASFNAKSVFVDEKFILNKLEGASFPAIIKQDKGKLSYHPITIENIDSYIN